MIFRVNVGLDAAIGMTPLCYNSVPSFQEKGILVARTGQQDKLKDTVFTITSGAGYNFFCWQPGGNLLDNVRLNSWSASNNIEEPPLGEGTFNNRYRQAFRPTVSTGKWILAASTNTSIISKPSS